jgi:xylulokinase
VARRWGTARGAEFAARERDVAAWERLSATLADGSALLRR